MQDGLNNWRSFVWDSSPTTKSASELEHFIKHLKVGDERTPDICHIGHEQQRHLIEDDGPSIYISRLSKPIMPWTSAFSLGSYIFSTS